MRRLLRRLNAGPAKPGRASLEAMDVAWQRVGDLAGEVADERLKVAGRALLLLVMAIDPPST